MSQDFVHLHVHSSYSLLDGLATPEAIAQATRERGCKAVAITDHGSINGHLRFKRACVKEGIKPLLGVEVYVCNSLDIEGKQDLYHAVIIAKSQKGWKNIVGLMQEAHNHKLKKPRIDFEILSNLKDVIVTTACVGGILSHPQYEKILNILNEHYRDDLYLEMMPIEGAVNNGLTQRDINKRAHNYSRKYGTKVVTTNDCHYIREGQEKYHNFLLSMATGGRFKFSVSGLYHKSASEMVFSCKQVMGQDMEDKFWLQSIYNTIEIADKVDDNFLDQEEISLPKVCEGDPLDHIREYSGKALEAKLREEDASIEETLVYQKRLEKELDVIGSRNFAGYFLLVKDFVDWAKSVDMELGRGRGSAGGSLLCSLLGITNIDPIKDDLLFERFLNPERTDYPDIDIDFPQSRRQEVLHYLRGKYGADRVANISTLSELKPRSAFKDVAKMLGINYDLANTFSEVLDDDTPIKEQLEVNQELRQRLKAIPAGLKAVDLADGILGVFRHGGIHAAGIVISPQPIQEKAFLVAKEGEEAKVVNWEMDDVSYLGWLKVDVLGLRSLDIIKEAKELIKQRHGKKIVWDEIDLEDSKILQTFSNGNTIGYFQFESAQVRHLCTKLKPIMKRETLIHINALVRPGPLDSGMTDKYIECYKNVIRGRNYLNHDEIKYGLNKVKSLRQTFGLIVFQEQVMDIAVTLAGYTIPQSDTLRKIISKSKGKEEIERHRQEFIDGCVRVSGLTAEAAGSLFDDISKHARYSFNKSHAAAYTDLALQQAYLKAYYPTEYMCALFKWTPDEEHRKDFSRECERLGVSLIGPDINKSGIGFAVGGDNELLIGLDSIHEVGPKAAECILDYRNSVGYKSLIDFRYKTPKTPVNKKVMEALLEAGAFGSLVGNQRLAIDNIQLLNKALDYQLGKRKTPVELPDFTDPEGDFLDSEKRALKAERLPGIYIPGLVGQAEFGLNIHKEELEKLKQEIGECRACHFREAYDCPVVFEYTDKSELLVIGEAPGSEENEQGKPFVGSAGKLLETEIFEYTGFPREKLFIANVYNCRPLDNKLPDRPPQDCYKHLTRIIEIIKPRFAVAFGRTPKGFFQGKSSGIQAVSGEVHVEKVAKMNIHVLYCIHPAGALRNGHKNNTYWKKAMAKLSHLVAKKIERERNV